MISIFQGLFLCFFVGVMTIIIQKYRTSALSFRGLFFWSLLWVGAAVIVLYPQMATIVANHFGIGRGSDFILYISIALMFVILFRLQVKIELMNRDVTKVVRKNAIEDSKNK
jgi:hypothetical protein